VSGRFHIVYDCSRDRLQAAVLKEVADGQACILAFKTRVPASCDSAVTTPAGQILVVAALLITLTFVGFTSTPGASMSQGYKTPAAQVNESSGSLVYSETPTNVNLAFWYMNSLAFFGAVVTALFSLAPFIVPSIWHKFGPEKNNMVLTPCVVDAVGTVAIAYATCALYFSGLCTLTAYTAAAVAVLPATHASTLLPMCWIALSLVLVVGAAHAYWKIMRSLQ
jgi:hypothetical protein